MEKVILIHGYTSSPTRTKYRIIAEELEKLGMECAIPILPGGEHPRSAEWLAVIEQEVAASQWPVVLVGHSLGTRAVLLYLDTYERHVAAVVLIAPFNNDVNGNAQRRGGNYADFFEYPVDIKRVRARADKFIVVHSTDDDAIAYQQGVDISKELGAELITLSDMGHLGGEERAEENAARFLETIQLVL